MGSRAGQTIVFTALLGLVVGLGVSGCVTVKPYEREYLALPEMNPASDALEESFYSHIESAREGAFGGHGAAGGGCGCG
jgi:hypothetical protein